MSNEAYQAERYLNTYQAKTGHGQAGVSDTTTESGIDANVETEFPGSEVKYGPGAKARGSNDRIISPEEGGRRDDRGRLTKGKDFLEPGAPEDKAKMETGRRPGDQDTLTGRMGGK
ncbi:hypothetical protein FQN52_000327 [Onygenales sp. PD_12]|nr:hypothetical protein FQN52_000327 [Onygenales sp. PD_12]